MTHVEAPKHSRTCSERPLAVYGHFYCQVLYFMFIFTVNLSNTVPSHILGNFYSHDNTQWLLYCLPASLTCSVCTGCSHLKQSLGAPKQVSYQNCPEKNNSIKEKSLSNANTHQGLYMEWNTRTSHRTSPITTTTQNHFNMTKRYIVEPYLQRLCESIKTSARSMAYIHNSQATELVKIILVTPKDEENIQQKVE